MTILASWRRWVADLIPRTDAPPPPLPAGWQGLSPEALWSHIKHSARFESPDPRARALVDAGYRPDTLELARWVAHQCPEQAPALFELLDYDLRLFATHGTPERLAAALRRIPSGGQAHPVDALASTPGWDQVSTRGTQWFAALACWAADHLAEDAQRTDREVEVLESGRKLICRLMVEDCTTEHAQREAYIPTLFQLVNHPRWTTWMREWRHRNHMPVFWEYRASSRRNHQLGDGWFEPGGTGWPREVRYNRDEPLLNHPIQALAHDRIWGTQHSANAYAMRGPRRWRLSLSRSEHRMFTRALLTWETPEGESLVPQLGGAELEEIVGLPEKDDIAWLLKSSSKAKREMGLALLGRIPPRGRHRIAGA